MSERILMQVSGDVRPLSFSAGGPILSTSQADGWAGVPLEVQPVGDWEGDAEMGPMRKTLGLLVFLEGHVEYLFRSRGRDLAFVGRRGDVSLISGEALPQLLSCRGQARVAAVDLSSAWVRAAAGDRATQLQPTVALGARRSLARHVVNLLRQVQSGPHDPLLAEASSFELISDVLDAVPGSLPGEPAPKLSPSACQRVQGYVRENLHERISRQWSRGTDLRSCEPTTSCRRAWCDRMSRAVPRARGRHPYCRPPGPSRPPPGDRHRRHIARLDRRYRKPQSASRAQPAAPRRQTRSHSASSYRKRTRAHGDRGSRVVPRASSGPGVDRFGPQFCIAGRIGMLSRDENEIIARGADAIEMEYLVDVVDREGQPTMVLRSGAERPVEPGSWFVNATGYFNDSPEPYRPFASPSGRLLAINPRSVLLFFARLWRLPVDARGLQRLPAAAAAV